MISAAAKSSFRRSSYNLCITFVMRKAKVPCPKTIYIDSVQCVCACAKSISFVHWWNTLERGLTCMASDKKYTKSIKRKKKKGGERGHWTHKWHEQVSDREDREEREKNTKYTSGQTDSEQIHLFPPKSPLAIGAYRWEEVSKEFQTCTCVNIPSSRLGEMLRIFPH